MPSSHGELIFLDAGELDRPAAIRAYNSSTKRSKTILKTHNAYPRFFLATIELSSLPGTERVGEHINIMVANLNH